MLVTYCIVCWFLLLLLNFIGWGVALDPSNLQDLLITVKASGDLKSIANGQACTTSWPAVPNTLNKIQSKMFPDMTRITFGA